MYKYPALAVLVVFIAFLASSRLDSFWELELPSTLLQSLVNSNIPNQDEMAASVTRNVVKKVLSIEQSEVRLEFG